MVRGAQRPTDRRSRAGSGRVLHLGSVRRAAPGLGGLGTDDRFDIVTHLHGLGAFDDEWTATCEIAIDGVAVRVLSLERILASKRAAGRPKDLAQIPALEEAIATRDG